MCLITTQQKSFKAETDITVYKIFKIIDEKLYSPFFGDFLYERGKVYKTTINKTTEQLAFDQKDEDYWNEIDIKWKCNNNIKKLGRGFHSMKEEDRAELYDNKKVLKVIIPKGSRYYENETGLIISNQILIPLQENN